MYEAVFIFFANVFPVGLAWNFPWYLDCTHSPDWTEFRLYLANSYPDYKEELAWLSHSLLERSEPIFLRVQNTKHLYYLCTIDQNGTELAEGVVFKPRPEGERSIFELPTGTDKWTDEEREARSWMVRDFCYFGYMAAATYRTRWLNDAIPGVAEGRTHARTLLNTLLMSRSNAIDFLDSSGWFEHFNELIKHIALPIEQAAVVDVQTADDTERPWSEVRSTLAPTLWTRGTISCHQATSEKRRLRVVAIGYHTSLVLEILSLWINMLQDVFEIEVVAHILEPGAGTAAEVRNASLCRDFDDGVHCAWDARLLELNRQHVRKSVLPRSQLPGPVIEDVPGFFSEFATTFQQHRTDASSTLDVRIDRAELFLCTEPALLCGAIARAFPRRPLVGYFANPLASYVPAKHAQFWLNEFRAIAGGALGTDDDDDAKVLLPVASTRFLAEQIRFQTGVRVLASRPLATYLGPPRGVSRKSDIVVVRAPSVFWSSACVLNDIVRLNIKELEGAHAIGKGLGMPVSGLRFIASEDLQDGATEAFAEFGAAVLFPYDVSQMRLYELYALAVPIYLPSPAALPCYLYRGMTTIDDFDHSLPIDRSTDDAVVPYIERNPFNRHDWHQISAWSRLTHWLSLPHLLHCHGIAHMLMRITRDDPRPTVHGMRRRQEKDIVRATRFWTGVLGSLRGAGF